MMLIIAYYIINTPTYIYLIINNVYIYIYIQSTPDKSDSQVTGESVRLI